VFLRKGEARHEKRRDVYPRDNLLAFGVSDERVLLVLQTVYNVPKREKIGFLSFSSYTIKT